MENIVAYLDTLYFGYPALAAILGLLIWYIYGLPKTDMPSAEDYAGDLLDEYFDDLKSARRNYENLNPQWRRTDLGEAADY